LPLDILFLCNYIKFWYNYLVGKGVVAFTLCFQSLCMAHKTSYPKGYGVFFWSVDYFTISRKEVGVPYKGKVMETHLDIQQITYVIIAICYIILAITH